MGRRVKDFIEISEYTSLDQLINTLTAIRDNLPKGSEPELRMKGDDVFGRRLSISYFRELTAEEATLDARYNGSDLPPAWLRSGWMMSTAPISKNGLKSQRE